MISLKNTLKLLVSLFLLMVSASQAGTSMTYIHTDHLGSPIAATDEAGQVKWTEEYQPFGVQRTNQDSDNSTGFTGHQYDDELELTYMQARWYHPEVGRFMALDPVDTLGHIQRGNPIQGFNRYAYANNNPYKYVDPDGEFLNFVFKFVADVAINATLNYLETGSVDLGSAVGDAAVAIVNPAKTLQKAKRIAQIVNKSDKVAKPTKGLKEQATDLVPLNNGKHRVTLRSEKEQLDIDLAGKEHNRIPTPHTKISPRNTQAPERLQPAYNTKSKSSTTRASTQKEIRAARKYLERKER